MFLRVLTEGKLHQIESSKRKIKNFLNLRNFLKTRDNSRVLCKISHNSKVF